MPIKKISYKWGVMQPGRRVALGEYLIYKQDFAITYFLTFITSYKESKKEKSL